MTTTHANPIKTGLAQIPTGDETWGLRGLIAWIDAGEPLCLDGDFVNKDGDP